MKIVFWNIYGKNIIHELTLLADEIKPDVLFLAECPTAPANVLSALNHANTLYYYNMDPVCDKILMFSKFYGNYVRSVTGGVRFLVKEIEVPNYPKFNIMALHYQSKVNWDSYDQAAQTAEYHITINEFEKKTNSKNTIVIGDFNMNPFEAGMIQTTGFHSTMSKITALKKNRIVSGKEYPFFYNPMWSFYGDSGKGIVNGTYYGMAAKPINYYWNIFDQILIRPDLIQYIEDNSIEIITNLGMTRNLIKANNIIDNKISDHLPISLVINKI